MVSDKDTENGGALSFRKKVHLYLYPNIKSFQNIPKVNDFYLEVHARLYAGIRYAQS